MAIHSAPATHLAPTGTVNHVPPNTSKPPQGDATVTLQQKFGGVLGQYPASTAAKGEFKIPLKVNNKTLFFDKTSRDNYVAQSKLWGKRAESNITLKNPAPKTSGFSHGDPKTKLASAMSGNKTHAAKPKTLVPSQKANPLNRPLFPFTTAPKILTRTHRTQGPSLQYNAGHKPQDIQKKRQDQNSAQRGGFHTPPASIDRKGEVKIA